MTLRECYDLIGDYDQVATRLPSASLIERFLLKFPDDATYNTLVAAMEAGNREEAFRGAHTLKGVCGNLSLTMLLTPVAALTEVLRNAGDAIPAEAEELYARVKEAYALTNDAIATFKATKA
ncbi:MAG: Hpt domain-containing protein [Clostridia bacterium]|nr:Hpt domain-containing protein [Clostridia bacterium]